MPLLPSAGGAAEILVMIVGPFLGLGVTLLPAQILRINLLTHGMPGSHWAWNRRSPTCWPVLRAAPATASSPAA